MHRVCKTQDAGPHNGLATPGTDNRGEIFPIDFQNGESHQLSSVELGHQACPAFAWGGLKRRRTTRAQRVRGRAGVIITQTQSTPCLMVTLTCCPFFELATFSTTKDEGIGQRTSRASRVGASKAFEGWRGGGGVGVRAGGEECGSPEPQSGPR